MSRVIIDDRWLKKDTPSRAKRALSQAHNPLKARVPDQYKTSTFGKGARWRARWYQQGKQHSKSFTTLEDANSFATAMEDDIRRGRYHDPRQENRAFQDVANEWLTTKIDIRPGTLGRYKKELRLYILPTFGNNAIGSITVRQVQDLVKQLQAGEYKQSDTACRKPRPLSARSIRNIIKIVMGGVIEYAIKQDWITSNPVRQTILPKPTHPALTIPTIEQVEQIARMTSELKGAQHKTLILFQAYVGTRIGETLALKVSNMDLSKGVAHIEQAWQATGTGKHILGMPKNGKPRDVAIPSFLIPDLQKQCAGKMRDDYVFTAPHGGPLYEETWRTRVWYPTLRALHMSDSGITVHSLRHFYASMAIAAGADVKTLQRQLGHSSASITLDIYASLFPSRLSTVADAISNFRSQNRV